MGKFCIATVTTDSFIAGTLVTIFSFLQKNDWFDSDVVIICDELSEQNRESLSSIYQKTTFLHVNDELLQKVEAIVRVFPNFENKKARYFSLETFRLRGYDKVLFLDSDLLFCGSVKEVFDLTQKFAASGDRAFYDGKGRLWGDGIEQNVEIETIYDTFNAGFFLVDKSLLTDENYSEVLKLVDPRIYKTPNMRLTDQVILNLFLRGRQHIISGIYNFLLAHRQSIFDKEKIGIDDAVVIHFNGFPKPWMTEQLLNRGSQDEVFLKACVLWRNCHSKLLQQFNLRF